MDVCSRLVLARCCAALWFCWSSCAWSQIDLPFSSGRPATLLAPQPVQPSPLQQAQEHESRGQWADALAIYQQALKQNPNDTALLHKRTLARIQCDLSRRCNDLGLIAQIEQGDPRKALSLYSEILQKIDTYHVETPDWHALSRYGLISLQAALANPSFRQRFLPQASEQQIQRAWEQLHVALRDTTVRGRNDSVWVAERTAQIMHDQLGLKSAAVFHEFVAGTTAGLDLYSSYLTRDQYQDTMSQIDGNFVGLGVELKLQNDSLDIVNVIDLGPAGQGGIRRGDKIIAVDGNSVAQVGAERCADLLRGLEGSFVSVRVQRPDGQQHQLSLQRRRVEIPSFDRAGIVDAARGVAYLRLVNFQKTTGQDLDAALWQLHRQGMRHLIIDVRGNPGGLLTAAVDVANRFIDRGVIVSTKGRNPLEDFTHQAQAEGTWRVPLVVLIDENSASASEIFAAAIADHGRGMIVGQQSYGKGSVQGIFPLNGNTGGLRLTTALFYSPRGVAISQRGVIPDVAVQQTAKPAVSETNELSTSHSDDVVLQTAIGLLRRQAEASTLYQATIAGQK